MSIIDARGTLQSQLMAVLDRALSTGADLAAKQVAAAHSRRPAMTPMEARSLFERRYLATVVASGGVAGGAGFVPGGGIPAGVLDAATFIALSVRLVLVEAALAGDPLDDEERLRTLALAALVGKGAFEVVQQAAKRTGTHLGVRAARAIPLETIRAINRVLGRNFVTRFGAREGILVLGKAMPAGVGAVIGAGGNAALATGVIKGAHVLCGVPVVTWDEVAVGLDTAAAGAPGATGWRPDDDGLAPAFA